MSTTRGHLRSVDGGDAAKGEKRGRTQGDVLSAATDLDSLMSAILGDDGTRRDERALILSDVERQLAGLMNEVGLGEKKPSPRAPSAAAPTSAATLPEVPQPKPVTSWSVTAPGQSTGTAGASRSKRAAQRRRESSVTTPATAVEPESAPSTGRPLWIGVAAVVGIGVVGTALWLGRPAAGPDGAASAAATPVPSSPATAPPSAAESSATAAPPVTPAASLAAGVVPIAAPPAAAGAPDASLPSAPAGGTRVAVPPAQASTSTDQAGQPAEARDSRRAPQVARSAAARAATAPAADERGEAAPGGPSSSAATAPGVPSNTAPPPAPPTPAPAAPAPLAADAATGGLAPAPTPVEADTAPVASTSAPVAAPPITPVPEAAPTPAAAAPAQAARATSEARLVRRVSPVYPATARTAGLGGTIELNVAIDATGRVTQAQAVAGHALLRAAAEEAVRRWMYEPATVNGVPVPSSGRVTVSFGARE